MLTRLHAFASELTDGRPLRLLRTLIGVLSLVKGIDLADQMTRIVGQPSSSWLGPIPNLITPVSVLFVIAVWLAAASAMALGWRPRLASSVLSLLVVGLIAVDQSLYNQHLYLLGLVCLLLSVADDVPRTGTRAVAAWPITLLRYQLSVVYAFGAIAKLSVDFVTGSVLFVVFARHPVLSMAGDWLLNASVLVPLAVTIIVIEAVLAIAPWFPAARWLVLAIAGPFHVGMVVFVPSSLEIAVRLLVFGGIQMAILLVAFAPRDRVTVVWDDHCSFCASWMWAFRKLDWLGLVDALPLSDPSRYRRLGVEPSEAAEALQLRIADGRVYGGFEAVRRLAYLFPATMLLAPWLALPPVRVVGARLYRRAAVRRRCAIEPRAIQARASAR